MEDPHYIIFLNMELDSRTFLEVFNKEELHNTISPSKINHLIQRRIHHLMKARA